MGVVLRLDSREWLHDWACPLGRAWAGIGVVFWALAPLLLRAGLLDTEATAASVALAGVAGLVAGVAGGALSAGHFVRTSGGT